MKDIKSIAAAAGNSAPLKTAAKPKASGIHKKVVGLPSDLVERFATIKDEGKTHLLLTAYLVEALREKLERDESN